MADVPEGSQGSIMPPVPWNVGFPSFADLPEGKRRGLKEVDRSPRIRLFCFYGVCDNVANWAAAWFAGAPAWAEVAIYEYRAHGLREAEDFDMDIEERADDAWSYLRPIAEQHALGGECEGAPFALLGHSSGVQLTTLLAERLHEDLGLEPAAVFIVDRAPPNIPLLSDKGHSLLCEDPFAFFELFAPPISDFMRGGRGTKIGDLYARRWSHGMRLAHEHITEETARKYGCPITVFVANYYFKQDKLFAKKEGMTPEQKDFHQRRSKILQSEGTSNALWDLRQYGMWRRWTSSKCGVLQFDSDHSSIVFHGELLKIVWRDLARLAKAS